MSDQPVDVELEAADSDDLDSELREFDAEDDSDGIIVGEGAYVIYDDETGETRLLVPVVIDEHGATTEVHVQLDTRAMSDLVAGIREARTVQRHLDGLPPLERSTAPTRSASEQDEDGSWSVTQWASGRRRIDPAGIIGLTPSPGSNKFLWLVIAVVVLSIVAAIAM